MEGFYYPFLITPKALDKTTYINLPRVFLTGTIKRNWEYLCSHNKENTKDLEDRNVDSTCEDREDKFDFSVI